MEEKVIGSDFEVVDSTVKPPILWAIFPVITLIALLGANVYFYGADSSFGPNQIALLLATAIAGLVGYFLNIPVPQMLKGIQKSISSALVAMLILLLIGSLTGTWMISGIVPAMIYYGLDFFDPKLFLFAAAVVCAIVSVVTGSSWSTVATVGIALLGIGKALGISDGLIAGAIISGAYFGDKISPLSDTTNLAAAMAGTELVTHIRYMLWTTIPSFVIALGIYLAIGFNSEPAELSGGGEALRQAIDDYFNLSPWLLLVPFLVLGMILLRFDAIVALFAGALIGGLIAICFQVDVVDRIANLKDITVVDADGKATGETRERNYWEKSYCAFVNSMALSTELINEGRINELNMRLEKIAASDGPANDEKLAIAGELAAADLLKGKGMYGMLNTIWLIITAMCFGGVMEACGLLKRLTEPLVHLAQSTGSLVATTACSCLFVNLTASDQYLSIVVPGRMYRKTFKDRGLAPENLSRTLEDSGTVTSVLIPWNTCGAAQRSVLGVDTLAFAPFCFFNLISPVMTIFFAVAGIQIAKLSAKNDS